jgi:hypothetical protein
MTNITIDENFNAVIDAVCYWLGYQFKIGRDQLIHEASLRYPIADTITAKGTAINRIVLEKLHPIFKSKKIDLVIYAESVNEPEAEKDDSNLRDVFEFKLSKSKTGEEYSDEHQRVFDDVVRLAYYSMWSNKDCYFLMCGKYSDFKNYFIGQVNEIEEATDGKKIVKEIKAEQNIEEGKPKIIEWESKGLYKEWFGFKFGEEKNHEFKIDESPDASDWGLKSFQNNYYVRDEVKKTFLKSIEIKTTCMAITPQGLEKSRTHAAGIWKIEGIDSIK